MLFEVRIPSISENNLHQSRTVEARDWFSALREALKQTGEDAPLRNVMCDLVEHGIYRVTESEGGRIFEIQEKEEDESLDVAPVETVERDKINQTMDHLSTINHEDLSKTITDLDLNQTINQTPSIDFSQITQKQASSSETSETAATEMNLPSFSAPETSELDTIDFSETMQDKPDKKALAATMQMDFAAIIDAQKQDKKQSNMPETMQMDFAAIISAQKQEKAFQVNSEKQNIKEEIPSVIISDEAYSTEPAHNETSNTVEEIKRVPSPRTSSPATPTPSNDLINELVGTSGKYEPGKTTEMLADVFMRAGEIHDFGTDKPAAAQFVLKLALGDVKAAGGGVLLTDINQPEKELWFEATKGLYADQLLNFRVPLGQGIVGYATQQGTRQIVSNIKDHPRFPNDIFSHLQSDIDSLLCAPIVYQDRIWGCIILYKTTGSRPFTQGELSIMTYLAHTTGEYLSSLV